MKGSLITVSFFVAGILWSVSGIFPFKPEEYNLSVYALCALMTLVGVSVGHDSQAFSRMRELDPRLYLLPIFTILGTLSGAAVAGLFLERQSPADCMAVGGGLAYYSLSSIIITEYKGAELGTIALMSNIIREIFALLAAPLLARWFGPLAPISAGGATTMDTTLPIIMRSSGNDWAVLSIMHGCIADFSVPFVVTFFCSI